jgi:PIN domain nuclease of toxin-antitoxin system
MRLLLDTHAFLWFVAGDAQLPSRARRRIEDPRHEKYLSVASVWEIAIKKSLGKLELEVSLDGLVDIGAVDNGILLLEVTRKHAIGVAELAFHHRDPFDRLLVSQAMSEEMAVISRDTAFDDYPVKRLW